jgi:glyoxylase-like metal-dependent hydrolase (beta-lactamase superfamily II)
MMVMGQVAFAKDGMLLTPKSVPKHWQLPQQAIDTSQIPEFGLDAKAADDKPLPVYRLQENVYFLFGNISTLNKQNRGMNGNAGFVVTKDGVVVIDSLGTPKLGRRLIATIRSVTDQPIKYLIVTHNHPDHAYGASAFDALEGTTIIAHQGTIKYNNSTTLQRSVEYRQELLPADMRGFRPLQADIYIKAEPFGKKEVTLGEAKFHIYNTGGHHSYGDLIVHLVGQKILWISDLAFNQRTTYLGDGDSAQILKAQDWLMQTFTDIALMVPGHGSVQTSPFPMVRKTRDYVVRMREAMRKAVENGVDMYDAIKNVEFEDWQDSRLYEQNQRANANFVYREMEKKFFNNF